MKTVCFYDIKNLLDREGISEAFSEDVENVSITASDEAYSVLEKDPAGFEQIKSRAYDDVIRCIKKAARTMGDYQNGDTSFLKEALTDSISGYWERIIDQNLAYREITPDFHFVQE